MGDLFEQLLNKGFKQNEGQFFTPMPITRFVWDCLPLETITHSEKGIIYPKIDTEFSSSRMTIDEYREKIKEVFIGLKIVDNLAE